MRGAGWGELVRETSRNVVVFVLAWLWERIKTCEKVSWFVCGLCIRASLFITEYSGPILVLIFRYIDNMNAFNPNGTDSLAFALGADPSETAMFIIKGSALRKPQIRFPFLQFVLGDVMEVLPRPLKLLAMRKTLPMIF